MKSALLTCRPMQPYLGGTQVFIKAVKVISRRSFHSSPPPAPPPRCACLRRLARPPATMSSQSCVPPRCLAAHHWLTISPTT